MLKFLRRHQKKVLAVFTAGLMIVFIVDMGQRRNQPSSEVTRRGRLIGEAGDFQVRANDVEYAKQEIVALATQVFLINRIRQQGQPQFVPLSPQLFGDQVIDHWYNNPAAYLLLQEEARRMGTFIDPRQLESVLSDIAIRDGDRYIAWTDAEQNQREGIRNAMARLLIIYNGYARAMDVIKPSRPLVMHEAVQGSQSITVKYVEFDAAAMVDESQRLPDEELQEHFRRYADVPHDIRSSETNPLAIGYRVPPKVKVQYLVIPRDQVRNAVKSKKDDYTWEREAAVYYLEHPREFQSATTQPTTQPMTRPFEEVRDEVLDRLMAPEVKRLAQQIEKHVQSTMRADFEAFASAQAAAAAPTTNPATATAGAPPSTQPANSSLGVRYDSFEYLQKLAESVQQRFGVLPVVHSLAELQTEEELAKVEGVGPFARTAFGLAQPFVPEPQRNDPNTLAVWEPSQSRSGVDENIYIYRLSDAVPAHPPAQLADVREQVVRDVQKLRAWNRVKADAQALLDEARKRQDLEAVAGDRPVRLAGPFERFAFSSVAGTDFQSTDARTRFVSEAYQLVSRAATQPSGKPAGLIDLPMEMKVLVAQLDDVRTQLSPQDLYVRQVRVPELIRRDLMTSTLDWFSLGAVSERLNYIDSEAQERQQRQQQRDASADTTAASPTR